MLSSLLYLCSLHLAFAVYHRAACVAQALSFRGLCVRRRLAKGPVKVLQLTVDRRTTSIWNVC